MDNNAAAPKAYVLVSASIDGKGTIHEAIVGVTFSLYDAEAHRDAAIENDFKGPFEVSGNFLADQQVSELALAMRGFVQEVERQNAEALA
jgi:hypothetical protein